MHHGNVVIIGYARVSTREQQLAMQIDALKSAGCTRILTDVASGAVSARPGLDLALDALGEGDTLVVCVLIVLVALFLIWCRQSTTSPLGAFSCAACVRPSIRRLRRGV